MRSILRRTTLLAAVIPVLVALSLTPASAATAQAGKTAVPNTLPTATLTSASVIFTTNDEDKDGDTLVTINVGTRTNQAAATISDYFDHFDDGSTHGPYPMFPFVGIKASDLDPGVINFSIDPNGHDTWRFNYSITLGFSDGTSFIFRQNGLELTQDAASFQTPFTLVAQVPVPDVVGDSQATAVATLQSAGLVVGSITHRVDPSCEHVNAVWTESPRAGTIVNPGTTVNLSIGDKPKICD